MSSVTIPVWLGETGRRSRRSASGRFIRAEIANELLPLRTQREILARFLVQARQIVVLKCLLYHSPGGLRTEVILAVETLHPFHQLGPVEAGVDDVRKLVAAV